MGENSPTGTESETERLASLLSEWREPGALVRVPPILVVPDATNREVRFTPFAPSLGRIQRGLRAACVP